MATQRAVHPSADVLKAFGLGKLDERSSGVVMNHLDQCETCRQQVTSLSGDDFLNRLRQAHGQSSTPAPAKPLADVARSAKALTGQTPIPNVPPELANNPQYEILRELGRGGMGVVYLAKNKLMDRLEVLKVVNKTLLDHPGAVERFLREIRSAAKLSHANVVAAYSAVQQGELLAFAMEYIEGEDLASAVKSQGPLPVPHACFYVQQAALGLQHAYEKGMVHRDIKPQNLILAREGKKHIVKVLDFGLAKVVREKKDDTGLTGEGRMLGTPDYIAPEQTMDAARADIRADIYSLGCTLYYLLSGHPPFSASSLGAILVAHQMHEAKPLNLVRPEVPEELAAVVGRMMVKTPAKRYQTPLEVVQALSPFVKQGTTPKASPQLSVGAVDAKSIVKKAAPVAPPPVPAAEAPKPEPAAVWESLMENSAASVVPRKSGIVRKPRAAAVRGRRSQKKWLLGSGIGVGVLLLALLGMWANGLFVKAKDGTIVLENLPADAEVTVDGEKVTLTWDDGGKKAEIRVKPGSHKIVATISGGVKVIGEEVEIDAGERRPIRVSLLPHPAQEKSTKLPAYVHGGGRWSIQGEELIQDSAEADIAALLFGDALWTDYEVTVKAKQKGGRELGFILFRYTNLLNGYYFGPWAGERELHLHTWIDGTIKLVVPDVPSALDDNWHTLRVRAQGSDLQCYLDENQIFNATDNRHRAGYVGLSTAKTACRFRNLKVTGADGRVLVRGIRDLEIQGQGAATPLDESFKVGAMWRGIAYPRVRNRDLPSNAMRIKIVMRKGTWLEAEYWESRKGLRIAGNIDAKGNISLRAMEILNGEDGGWPDAILDTTLLGTVAEKQMRIVGFYPDGLTTEIRATRED